MAMGYAAGSFALLCMLAFISGACLNGANTGMNALSARYYPTQARATGERILFSPGTLRTRRSPAERLKRPLTGITTVSPLWNRIPRPLSRT
jgi:hypothetical protein